MDRYSVFVFVFVFVFVLVFVLDNGSGVKFGGAVSELVWENTCS